MSAPARRRRVGKARGGKGGFEPRARIRERAARVLALEEQGWVQQDIAEALGISQAAVSKILHREDARAGAALRDQTIAHRMRRIRRLEYVARESRRAWEASKGGRVRKRQRKAGGGSGDEAVMQEIIKDEHPDPRLLDQARKAEEAIGAICGLTGSGPRGDRTGANLPDEFTFVFEAPHDEV